MPEQDNFTSDAVTSLISSLIGVAIVMILFIKFLPSFALTSLVGCQQELAFRQGILGLSFGDVNFMQDMARWGWLSGLLPPLKQCSISFKGYVINNSYYKSPEDVCPGCGYEFKTKQQIIDAIVQALVDCWATYRNPSYTDNDSVLYYDRNPAPCTFIDLYLANETINIKYDIIDRLMNGYVMSGENKIYWNESDLYSWGVDRMLWKYTNAVTQSSVAIGDTSSCDSNVCKIDSLTFDDSNFLSSASGTCQSDCSPSEYPYFNYDSNLQCSSNFDTCPPSSSASNAATLSSDTESSRNTWHELVLDFNCQTEQVKLTVDSAKSTGWVNVINFNGINSLHLWTNGADTNNKWYFDSPVLYDDKTRYVAGPAYTYFDDNDIAGTFSSRWTSLIPSVATQTNSITIVNSGCYLGTGNCVEFFDNDASTETEAWFKMVDSNVCKGTLYVRLKPSSYQGYQCSVSAGGVAMQYTSDGYWRLYIPQSMVWSEDLLFENTSLMIHFGDYLYYQSAPNFNLNLVGILGRYAVSGLAYVGGLAVYGLDYVVYGLSFTSKLGLRRPFRLL